MEHLNVTQWIAISASLLLAISEILPFTSVVKSNGIFQAVLAVLGFVKAPQA